MEDCLAVGVVDDALDGQVVFEGAEVEGAILLALTQRGVVGAFGYDASQDCVQRVARVLLATLASTPVVFGAADLVRVVTRRTRVPEGAAVLAIRAVDLVAGLRHVKDFVKKLAPQLREGQKGVPQSMLLSGVPGCGKSAVVSALANRLGWVLIQFRNIRGPYVGQSEQQLEHVIRVAEQFERSIIFFDEIDQFIGQRGTGASGDSGTSERMLARIMAWLGSMKHRGKILFVGASNRPDLLDPAMIDRFRVSIPVLYPTLSDLLELIPILLERFGRQFAKDIPIEKAASMLDPLRLTGRSLQEILIHAGFRADSETGIIGGKIGMKHLADAASDHLPSEDPLEMKFIALTSLAMCSANSFLPWMSMGGLRDAGEIPEELIADNIVDPGTGLLNKVELQLKLGESARARQHARIIR